MSVLALSFRLAGRELRAGFAGFYIFLACLALGVAAIAAAGTAAQMFTRGVGGELGTLLGGDIQVRGNRLELDTEQRAQLERYGVVSEVLSVSTMVEAERSGIRRLVDLRGVDALYPLYGAMTFDGTGSLSVLNPVAGVYGAIPSAEMMTAFDLVPGDTLKIGESVLEVRASALTAPDDSGIGFEFSPRLTVSLAALRASGLIGEGSLYTSRYRIRLPADASPEAVQAALDDTLDSEDWETLTRAEVGDRFGELLQQLSQFLAIAGLAALIAGGLGVSQAVAAFLASRIETIAAMKTLGASPGLIFLAYMIQIMALATLGSLIGVVVGGGLPIILVAVFAVILPLPAELALYPLPLVLAFSFGVLAALAFALMPVGRARATPPAALISGAIRGSARTPWPERIGALLAFGGFAGLAIVTSPAAFLTTMLLAATLAAFLILALSAWGVRRLAALAARGARGRVRIVLANLAGPASVAPAAAPALGLGLALLAFITLVQTNLVYQLGVTAPSNAPSLVITQIPHADAPLMDTLAREAGIAIDDPDQYRRAPILFARITTIAGVPVDEAVIASSERWVVDGEVAVSILASQPQEAVLTTGAWWPEDYSGPALISMEADAARGLGVGPGDTLGIRVFGREFDAEIANLRQVDWGGFGVNVAVIFAPGTLEAANPAHTAIIRATPETEGQLIGNVGRAIPRALIIPVRERLAAAADVFAKASRAVSLVAGVVIAAGALVMLGAFATAARRRGPDAALLKTLGLTPVEVLGLYALEFALVGLMAAGLASAFAVAGAYPVIIEVFEAEWSPDWRSTLIASLLAVAGAALGGALTARAALAQPAARALREG